MVTNPRISDVPLFPSPKDPGASMQKDITGRWLRSAERLAGLPPLAGGIWHPYRRLFAIENKALPIHDVAAAGGWSSVEAVQRIYQKPEAKGVLKVMQNVDKGA
jgi:integrase